MIAANRNRTPRARRALPHWLSTLLLVAAWTLAPAVHADEDLSAAFQSLRGLRAVALRIDGMESALVRYGVTEPELRAGVESRLRDAGVQVIPTGELAATAGAALLEVRLRTVSNAANLLPYWSYSMAVIVRQKVALPNAPDAFVPATIWSGSEVGALEPLRLTRLYAIAYGLVDGFVAELRRQNAR